MSKYFSRFSVVATLILVIGVIISLVSGCDIGLGQQTPVRPVVFGIITPPENVKVLAQNPVQIQSAFQDPAAISRAELWIREPNTETEKLLRSDVPSADGIILQEWVPQQPGNYGVLIKTYNARNEQISQLTRSIQVLADDAIAPAATASAGEFSGQPQPTRIWASPTLTATVGIESAAAEYVPPVEVVAEPTATPTPFFPPPPAAPGVPPGPTQEELPKLIPPVCDAAEYLGPFTSDDVPTDERIFIPTDDQVPAKVSAGTMVHRAWKIRNIGTCTWGPNYELAFYGGRAMGSGGVPFEAFYPSDAPRRNALIDRGSLIVPEGKPNEIAVAEILMQAPVIPGIHQSYWRMRNPQGVYFGPIVGVTLEVVRDCKPEPGGPRIYGAPFIRRFRILGSGTNLAPEGAGETVPYRTEVGRQITVDWEVINASNFDIVFQSPTGDIETLSSVDPSDRAIFTPSQVGDYTATLFVDNGSCSYSKSLSITVRPPEANQFVLSATFATGAPVTTSDTQAAFSPDVRVGTIQIDWDHYDNQVNEVIFHADRYVQRRDNSCLRKDWLGIDCPWGKEQLEESKAITLRAAEDAAAGTAQVCNGTQLCRAITNLNTEIPIVQGATAPNVDELVASGGQTAPIPPQGLFSITQEQHSRLVFCRPPSSANEIVFVNYYVEARINGSLADPPYSNVVKVTCGQSTTSGPPVEIPD